MVRRLSCRLDQELDLAIAHFGEQNQLTRSQAVRELLRQILTNADPVDRGWREGFTLGQAEGQKALQQALHSVKVR